MRIYFEDDFLVSKWTGGITTQLLIFPTNSSVSEQNFDWRISTATIEVESSEFTKFYDYNRIILPLEGRLEMTHVLESGETRSQILKPYRQASFSGDWQTNSKGKLVDFNVIYKKKLNAQVEILETNESLKSKDFQMTDICCLMQGILELANEKFYAPVIFLLEEREAVIGKLLPDSCLIHVVIS